MQQKEQHELEDLDQQHIFSGNVTSLTHLTFHSVTRHNSDFFKPLNKAKSSFWHHLLGLKHEF